MPTTQRNDTIGIVQQLLDEPYRFKFVQAVRLIECLLVRHGVARSAVLSDYLQFRNSTSLSFPASEIESLAVHGDDAVATEEELLAALENGVLRQLSLTPAFIGLLGNQGALANHYSERIAAHEHDHHDLAPRAYMDLFSNRMVALFYQAWRKHRLELARTDDARDGLLPLLLSLSGSGARPVPDAVAGYYAAAFRQRPVSAPMMERVLSDYFAIPVKVIPNLGRWHVLDQTHATQLGRQNSQLGTGFVLGPRLWRRDLKVALHLGPLTKAQHDHFLKDGDGATALRRMLSMFDTPTLQYEVQLVLRAADVRPARLSATGETRLGMNCVMRTKPIVTDWPETRYLIKIE